MKVRVRVWDLPVRLFHWLLVALLVFQVVSGKVGGRLTEWHLYSGYAIFALLVFRVLWGFAGSASARFVNFVVGPAKALHFGARLLARRAEPYAGHNPLGGWMVVALLVLLALQVASGLFSNDGIATDGPLASRVSVQVSDRITALHRWNAWVLIALSALHTAAALYHWLVMREDLIAGMLTGMRRLPGGAGSADLAAANPWRALLLLLVAVAAVWMTVRA